MQSSTFRSALDPTIAGPATDERLVVLAEVVLAQWDKSGEPDMVVTLRQHPQLLGKRSLLLNLAITEYKARRRISGELNLESYCERFHEFGSSIHRSIQRQLEVQRSLDEHPELWGDISNVRWPQTGEIFGGFQVLEELGNGAIARVYLCLEAAVGNRTVVVKVSPFPSIEASILGQLNHANIIPIHYTDFVDDQGLHYVCMPYCGRSTLLDLLDEAFKCGCPRTDKAIALAARRWTSNDDRLPLETNERWFRTAWGGTYVDGILKLAVQIANALEHAHQKGILHGDLKPSNVLLSPAGRPILLDFNLSRNYAHLPGVCGGTLLYMPPEDLQVVAGDLLHDQRAHTGIISDIYSYGALLYELLTGVTPVCGQGDACDWTTMAKQLLIAINAGIRPLRERNRFVSRNLESIILRCLSVDHRARPTTITDVKRALHQEMLSIAALGRHARIRPILFTAAVGLPLAAFGAGIAYRAAQPPQHVAEFEIGKQMAADGDRLKAVDHFTAAVASNPSFAPARFELGRVRLQLGDVDRAANEFGVLAQSNNNLQSMAYYAYCFNLKRASVAAIPWYERLLDRGKGSVAVYNNLGASYLDASSHLSPKERLSRAEFCLIQAQHLAQSSSTVQLNIVRHAVAKSQLDSKYNPFAVWSCVERVIELCPNDRFVESHLATWYHAVLHFERANSDLQGKPTSDLAVNESSLRARVADIYAKVQSANAAFPYSFQAHSESSVPFDRYYLEPKWP